MYMYGKYFKIIFITWYWISYVHYWPYFAEENRNAVDFHDFWRIQVYTITWNDLMNILAEGVTTVLQGTIYNLTKIMNYRLIPFYFWCHNKKADS